MTIFRSKAVVMLAICAVGCADSQTAEDRARVSELEARLSDIEEPAEDPLSDAVFATAPEEASTPPTIDDPIAEMYKKSQNEKNEQMEKWQADRERQELEDRIERLEQENLNQQINKALN
jgi:DNA-binding transcriptional regulator YbjK